MRWLEVLRLDVQMRVGAVPVRREATGVQQEMHQKFPDTWHN